MSIYTNRAITSLLNMINEMDRKNIEISRITKTAALLLMSGLSPKCINSRIVNKCVESQQHDGGFVGNSDTIWNICLLKHYKQYQIEVDKAIEWLSSNSNPDGGFGRTKRDMSRIPVTGLALYLIPQISEQRRLEWLENTWLSELNSLTYKAAYTLLAFHVNDYNPKHEGLISDSMKWIATQQEGNGGYSPWLKHPVGANIYCTAIAALGLLSYGKDLYTDEIIKAYEYMKRTQLISGVWPYHEIEDGSSWGLYAMTKIEEILGDRL